MQNYIDTFKGYANSLFNIDSPTGYKNDVTDYLLKTIQDLGYSVYKNNLGNVIATIDGENNDTAVAISAHVDTLGLMVRSINSNGDLRFTVVGSPLLPSLDGEYCRIRTREGKVYTGVIASESPAIHVFTDASTRPRDEQNMVVRIDETVHSQEDVTALGIRPGDYICIDTKTTFTESGFLKSRFIDDKGCASILLTVLDYFKKENKKPQYKTYLCFTVHEEIGYGGATLPKDISELLVADMGCFGDDLSCNEEQVSICAKDNCGPFDYDMTTRLIKLAEKDSIDYAVDIYPRYSSDGAALLRAGYDTRVALIGPGVYGSHGMERTHLKGIYATFRLILSYLNS